MLIVLMPYDQTFPDYKCHVCNPAAHRNLLETIGISKENSGDIIKQICEKYAWPAYCHTVPTSQTPHSIEVITKLNEDGRPKNAAPASFMRSFESAIDRIVIMSYYSNVNLLKQKVQHGSVRRDPLRGIMEPLRMEVEKLKNSGKLTDVRDLGVLSEMFGYVYKGRLWNGL